MGIVRLFSLSAKEEAASISGVRDRLPDIVEFIDTESFEAAVNTILNEYDSRIRLSVSKIEAQDSNIVIRGSIRNHCEIVCLFVAYVDGYDSEKQEIKLSFNLVVRGSALIKTHIIDNVIYFDEVVENNTERIGRWK